MYAYIILIHQLTVIYFFIYNTYNELDYMIIVSVCLLRRTIPQTLRQPSCNLIKITIEIVSSCQTC